MATVQINTTTVTHIHIPNIPADKWINEAIKQAKLAGFGQVLKSSQSKQLIDWSRIMYSSWGDGA